MFKSLPTMYKNCHFRSRLEARWAVYFDEMGIDWQYEREGYDLNGIYYLPDFWLPQVKMWAEVKPFLFSDEEMVKIEMLIRHTGFPVLMLIDAPDYQSYDAIGPSYDPEFSGSDLEDCDYILDNSYLHENRFFASTGCRTKKEFQENYQLDEQVQLAINISRGYRFDGT